jgi:KDO2-lipid IV(A) lauroyltransferase
MPADLRQGEPWTPLQRLKNDTLWTLASVALLASRPLSLLILRRIGSALGAAAHALLPRARRTAHANVLRVFPHFDERQKRAFVRRCFATLGELLGETVALYNPLQAPPLLPLSEPTRTLFDEVLREGRGVVFASAHLGPWERVAASLVAAGVPLVTLARESYDPRFSRLYDQLRSAHGVRAVWRGTPGAATSIVRILRAGGVLGVPMDLRARVASCDAPFLGHDAPTAIGPARIALRTGAAVVVGTAAPMGDALAVTATRIATEDLPPGAAAVGELTCRINRELSHRILALPHAWVWMHERWRPRTGV